MSDWNDAVEAVAAMLDADADRQEKAWRDFLRSKAPGSATTFHTIPRSYAKQARALKR